MRDVVAELNEVDLYSERSCGFKVSGEERPIQSV